MIKNYTYPSPVIADRIQDLFFEHNLTDRFVADQIGCDRKSILKYRNAVTNPSIKFIRFMCSTYHVSADWLLDLEEK